MAAGNVKFRAKPEPRIPRLRDLRAGRCEETGKHKFRSKEDALAVLSRASHKKAMQRAYDCPFCDGWHLTKQPARRAV